MTKSPIKSKEKIEFNKVKSKTKEEVLAENIAKIDGFVPYEDHSSKNIIDSTKIKKGRERV